MQYSRCILHAWHATSRSNALNAHLVYLFHAGNCRVPVGQGQASVALQQVITSPVLLATLAGILLRVFQLPVPPTVSPNL